MNEATESTFYGFYSHKHVEHFPESAVALYATPEGGTVQVTCVSRRSDNPKEAGYMWDDAFLVGRVTHCLRGTGG